MTPICNDQLTRIRNPPYGKDWLVPRIIRVGDKGMRGSTPFTVKAFGMSSWTGSYREPITEENPRTVWMLVKMRGWRDHKWLALMIGDTNSFQEKIVLGGIHPNPVFTHYHPKGEPQPL